MIPPRKKLEKLVMATAVNARKAVKMSCSGLKAALPVKSDIAAESTTTNPVVDPSTNQSLQNLASDAGFRRFLLEKASARTR